MPWSFKFAHTGCSDCAKLRLDAILLASAENNKAGSTYTDSAGHSATAYKNN